MENILTCFEMLHRFVFTPTTEDVSQGKPHPEIYLQAAENMNVVPDEMLVFEDSQAGLQSAGVHVVVIPHEHTENQDPSSATLIAESLHHHIAFLNNS